MVWYSFVVDAGIYLVQLFLDWLKTIFVVPFQTSDMLWLLVPVWIAWFFSEFFQEKMGTSMGNAISNAVVILWGSIDCTRQTAFWMAKGVLTRVDILSRFAFIGMMFAYGAFILYMGIKGKEVIRYIGRVRQVTYIFIMFVPIFYRAIPFTWNHIIAAIIFFPIFYFIIELIDRYTPDPQALKLDMRKTERPAQSAPLGLPQQNFNQYNQIRR